MSIYTPRTILNNIESRDIVNSSKLIVFQEMSAGIPKIQSLLFTLKTIHLMELYIICNWII